jgi:adenylate cyclase
MTDPTSDRKPEGKAWTRYSRRFALPLALVLGGAFGTLVLIALVAVLAVTLGTGLVNTRAVLASRAEGTVDDLRQRLFGFLLPAETLGALTAGDIGAGRLDPADAAGFALYVRGALAGSPQLLGVGFLTPDLLLRRYIRDNDAVVEEHLGDNPQIRAIAQETLQQRMPLWGQPIIASPTDHAILNFRQPVFRDGQFWGLVIVVVSVERLSELMMQHLPHVDTTPFVLYAGDRVLVHPQLAQNLPTGDRHTGTVHSDPFDVLPDIQMVADPYLAGMWSAKDALLPPPATHFQSRALQINGRTRFFVFDQINRFADRPLVVGAHFGNDIARSELMRLYQAALAGLAVLVLAVLAAFWLGGRAARPILAMAAAAQRVLEGDFGKLSHLRSSSIRELGMAATAFNRMVDGLRERQATRDLLGTYVPRHVAEALLRDQGRLEPRAVEGTILFVDIAQFTTISEHLRPAEIVAMLNDYFSVLVGIIERHGGVVTQFQGDAVLATFNVPLPDPDHATQAIAAAREIRRAVAHTQFSGQALKVRMGISTGQLIAGPVGAIGRLSYTVHGDAVNLASRLEQLNKMLGTTILASGRTAELAGTDAGLTRVDATHIRGRTDAVVVFAVDAPEISPVGE